MNIKIISFYILLSISSFFVLNASDEIVALNQKPIVVIIPSYNNRNYYQKNLDSIFMQNYDNYHMIYVDDCSRDQTGPLVRSYIEKRRLAHRVTLIENKQRQGALANLYHAIHACPDDAIIITVDGDDWLSNPEVFNIINRAYADPNVWITFGQFVFYPDGRMGYCRDIKPEEFDRGRRWCHLATHMRTFYAGLFKKIKREDLLQDDGKFFEVTWDKAMMAPMLEMAHWRWKFIPDVVYIYNFSNPLSDARLYGMQQLATAELIYKKEQYLPLPGPLPY
jgi:glycosyltransferase involved in cell wall biosynthesis